MNLRSPAAAVVCGVLMMVTPRPQSSFCAAAQQRASPPPDFQQLLQNLARFSADPCGPAHGEEKDSDADDLEFRLFSQAADAVSQALNATANASSSPAQRAATALKNLEQMSGKVNAAWPEDSRFHFQILDLSPALVVRMSIRRREGFRVFGMPEEVSGKPNRAWQKVGSDEESREFAVPPSEFKLYALHRGPSGNARFLAKAIYSGCAGSLGIGYDAREWDPKGAGDLERIISQEGALGLDDKVPEFEQIGNLQTEGSLITLPYCWFSAIDTWDNPSLCAVDTYDIGGDEVRFRSRAYNRPDLVPVAKAMEYAEKRDYPAVLGYCTSEDVARALVRELPPDMFAEDLRVTRVSHTRERVEIGDPPAYEFEVEKRPDRWVVVKFSAE